MRKSMYRVSALLLAALLLTSCGRAAEIGESKTDTSATTTAQSVVQTTTIAAQTQPQEPTRDPKTLYIVEQGKTEYTVILPGGSLTKPGGKGFGENAQTGRLERLPSTVNTPLVEAASALVDALAEKTGVRIPITDDSSVRATAAGSYEILIGLTDRPESIALHKTLKARTFAVQTTENKMVIVGYDDHMTTQALRYCIEHFVLGTESVGQVIEQGSFTVPVDMKATSPQEAQTPANTIHIGGAYTLKEAEVFAEIAKDGDYKVMQGAATDGLYLYYCIENQKLSAHESYIYKVDAETGRIVGRSRSLQLDHSNDMTFNSKRNQLVVVHNAPNRKLVSFVDIDTLQKVETINIGKEIFCIAYNEARDQYVVGLSGGQNFAIMDSEFQYVREYIVPSTGYTTQGMTCDDQFLYFAQSGANVVVVYDWDGHQVAIIPIEFTGIETENICILGNDMYIGFYRSGNGGIVYKTRLTVKQ